MTSELSRENKMGTKPVFGLIVSMSLPMMASMLVQALYNVVDTYFVSMLSNDALTAVSDAFAAQNLMIGIATGTGVGINALLSRSLGEHEYKKANRVAGNGILLACFGCLLSVLFGLFLVPSYFKMISDITKIQELGVTYLRICCVGSLGIFIEVTFERLMQSTGKTIYTMFTQGLGAIVNIILDPCLIFGLGPFPEMGIAGAAVATVIGQFASAALAVILHFTKNREIKITSDSMKPDKGLIWGIYSVGIPSIIMVAIGSVMNFAINIVLKSIDPSEIANSVFGIYYKLQSFVFMPVFGLNNGLIPIVAYNFGAKKKDRMIKAIKYATFIALAIMAVGLMVFQLIPKELLNIFAHDAEKEQTLLSVGVPALRTISLCFVFAGVCIVLGAVFQALGKGHLSMYVSIARQLVVLVPVAYLLSLTGKVSAVWFSFPIAEIMSLAVTIYFFVRLYKSVIQKLPDKGAEK